MGINIKAAEDGVLKRKHNHDLHVTVPSFFRCPISLDVMTSPVSLCTGVTYDRSSIQRWLDAGHNVCPATMQPLPPSHDLVPNHTLHRLIRHWSSSSSSSAILSHSALVDQVILSASATANSGSGKVELDPVLKLLSFASESAENRKLLSRNDALVRVLVRETQRFEVGMGIGLDLVEAAVKLLRLIARAYEEEDDGVKSKSESNLLKLLRSLLITSESLSSLGRILRHARPDSRIALAQLLQTLTVDSPDSQITVIDNNSVLTALILGGLHHRSASDKTDSTSDSDELVAAAYISCLITLSSQKRNKSRIVAAGGVTAIGKLIARPRQRKESGGSVTEGAVRLLESVCGCVEGRKAVGEEYENCVTGIVSRVLMRVSCEATESGVAVLWGMCCVVRDKRARQAVVATGKVGMTKVLLVMQSGCEERVKRMCGDLLRLFTGSTAANKSAATSGSCFVNYECRTNHIMPY